LWYLHGESKHTTKGHYAVSDGVTSDDILYFFLHVRDGQMKWFLQWKKDISKERKNIYNAYVCMKHSWRVVEKIYILHIKT
jgi:hypothetical protein